jgi:hypothetical protein
MQNMISRWSETMMSRTDFWEPNIIMGHNVQNITSPIRYEVGRMLWRRNVEITINK